MKFIAYHFDCWPVKDHTPAGAMMSEKVDGEANFKNRIGIINSLFEVDTCHYTLGDGSTPVFKQDSNLVLRYYKIKKTAAEQETDANAERQRLGMTIDDQLAKPDNHLPVSIPSKKEDIQYSLPLLFDDEDVLPMSQHDILYAGRLVYHHEGVTILRVQKKQRLTGEDINFKPVMYSQNYASQMVILVARNGLQYVFVESIRKAFSPATLSYIIESTLNRLLKVKYNVMLQVSPVRKLSDFWQTVNQKQQSGVALRTMHFKFGYPNMPWPDDLLGGRFKKLGMELNADADIILKGHHGQPLNISTKSGERDADINSMARYSCDRGNEVVVTYSDRSKTSFGYKQTGTVDVDFSDRLNDMHTNCSCEMFPEFVSDEIAHKAKAVKNMNEGV